MKELSNVIITLTLLVVIIVLAYLIGGRNALIYFPIALFFGIYHYGSKWWNKKMQQRIEKKVKKQLAQAPKRTSFPTIPGMKNPLQEDLEREEERSPQLHNL